MKIWRTIIGLFLGGILSSIIQADDKMWMPHQMKDLNLKAAGLQMNPEDLFRAEKELIAKAEKGSRDLRCTVARMYSGNYYCIFKFKRIRDVRFGYAPPQDPGNFGGEVDNGMWPRHTCDFSFLRAYVAKDGSGAEYSPDNAPYQPKSFLKISLEGMERVSLLSRKESFENELRKGVERDPQRQKRYGDILRQIGDYHELPEL